MKELKHTNLKEKYASLEPSNVEDNKINKENTPPEGWTEEAKAGASQAAAIGLSLSDLDDSGDMAAELAEIMDLNSDLYK